MRQSKKEIKDKNLLVDLLNTCHIGRLGTVGKDGYPMVKPLNFAYCDNTIYFHTAQEGEKIDDIRRDSRVCFEVDLPIALVRTDGSPCKAEYLYRSVIIRGRARIIEDESERRRALKSLMEKYQPEGGYGDFSEEKLKITGVVRIDIEEMTGKEDLGKEKLREAALEALDLKVHLPLILKRV
ncbi:MAG TPA: pyridoxamine 5'-phosphate oxidase family protein [Nitrospirota bacterium]|nr:pyridoxamine 5'-phosphate oxidase family protein [Nitrospirota bacterium]